MIRYARALMWAGPFALLLTLFVAGARAGEAWYPIEVDVWDPPFNTERKRHTETYMALDKAAGAWRICVSIPHLKDDYWLAVNFGIYDEAKRLGVDVNLYEAGGYDHLETQRRQIVECMERGADGLIVSAISADGLNDLVARYAEQGRPVIDLINGLSSPRITARVAVDFWDMGNHAARYLRNMLADSGNPVRVAWFPGPEGAAWVAAGDQGFQEGIEGSAIEIIASANGDTGRATQGRLVGAVLDAHPDLDLILGTAVTAEAAVTQLSRRGLSNRVRLLAYYYSPGVHRGIRRGWIVAAPTDQPAIQARIALNQIVRVLEKRPFLRHVATKVRVVDHANMPDFDSSGTLPPSGFRPIFSVNE